LNLVEIEPKIFLM